MAEKTARLKKQFDFLPEHRGHLSALIWINRYLGIQS